MSEATNKLARLLREQIDRADEKDVSGRLRLGEVVGSDPLAIMPLGGRIALRSADLMWSNTALQTREQWAKGDTVILARTGGVYTVVDILGTGTVMGGGPIQIEDVEGLQAELDALQDQIDAGAFGDKDYTFTQNTPASTWNITHPLGKFPSVVIVDSGGTNIEAGVVFNSISSITVTFAVATSGKAYLN